MGLGSLLVVQGGSEELGPLLVVQNEPGEKEPLDVVQGLPKVQDVVIVELAAPEPAQACSHKFSSLVLQHTSVCIHTTGSNSD